ncbi:putative PfkB family kinase [Mytilinidion resinicola]|uniref:PfkB family kinase n=1 Tax=Mytilinidion resinicola TaxID=574789 RepID=A0A6A6YCZ3_9PEZI|nr:putative PfkB family kinase [Mytilinidion resinicola]KAF2806691.1 putative PfkB family kinase [Mytilinidion resinicola]
MPHITAVGACYLDTILTIPHYPPEDAKLRSTSLSRRRGGNGPNTLEVLSQLSPPPSLSLSLITILPSHSSPATQEVQTSLPAVDISHSIFREGFTEAASSYVLRSLETGSRTIVNFNELPEMTAEELKGKVGEVCGEEGEGEGQWWHFEGRIPDVTLACVQHLRARFPEAKISVEAENPTREGLEEVTRLADVVFYSKSWAVSKGFTGAESMRAFLEAQAAGAKNGALLCLTWGSLGAAALDCETSQFEYVHAWRYEGRAAVDTIGAGDTFVAGMLYCENVRCGDWSLKEKLAFANELAGRKVLQEGFAGLGDAMQDLL